jgi:DNA-binding transcriptional LysR family regulator
MDRLDAMTVFRAAVDTGSLSAAGRKLGMPLATVSRKLADLESHLKARLLHRSTRKLSLTDAGEAYLVACKRILDEVEEAERGAAGEFSAPKGELVVTAPILFGRLHVQPVAIDFLRAYPDVDVRLAFGDRVLNLLDEHVDLAVRVGELPDSSLVATRLGTTRRVVCASPEYLAVHGEPAAPEDLARHHCLSFEAISSADAWRFRVNGSELSAPVHSRLIASSADAAIEAAIAGIGLTRVYCYQVEEARRAGRLKIVLGDYESAPAPVSLVYQRQGRLPLKVRAFLDFATPRLRARLAGTNPPAM